jgi:eukaryotic translation initiation factor 2C
MSSETHGYNSTFVDRRVTEGRNWDFFLQTHSSYLSTVVGPHGNCPCGYKEWSLAAIRDVARTHTHTHRQREREREKERENKPSTQRVSRLFPFLCYHVSQLNDQPLGKATKAISIYPPTYCADLVCERARCYLSNVFDGSSPAASVSVGTEI